MMAVITASSVAFGGEGGLEDGKEMRAARHGTSAGDSC